MIFSCGEALVDFVPGAAAPDGETFVALAGGSPCNVAVGLARLDVRAGFVGALSTDMFGARLLAHLAASGVETNWIARLDAPTTLAFVSLGGGEPAYAFYDCAAADRNWRRHLVPSLPAETQALHFGSIALLREPAAEEFCEFVLGERRRLFLSFDPNIRAGLIRQEAAYRARLAALTEAADLIKLSLEDLAWLAPGRTAADAAAGMLGRGAGLVAVTGGAAGAELFAAAGRVTAPAPSVAVADTIGAGDAFTAALLAFLSQNGLLGRARLAAAPLDVLAAALDVAVRAAAIACTRRGADLAWRHELEPNGQSGSRSPG